MTTKTRITITLDPFTEKMISRLLKEKFNKQKWGFEFTKTQIITQAIVFYYESIYGDLDKKSNKELMNF